MSNLHQLHAAAVAAGLDAYARAAAAVRVAPEAETGRVLLQIADSVATLHRLAAEPGAPLDALREVEAAAADRACAAGAVAADDAPTVREDAAGGAQKPTQCAADEPAQPEAEQAAAPAKAEQAAPAAEVRTRENAPAAEEEKPAEAEQAAASAKAEQTDAPAQEAQAKAAPEAEHAGVPVEASYKAELARAPKTPSEFKDEVLRILSVFQKTDEVRIGCIRRTCEHFGKKRILSIPEEQYVGALEFLRAEVARLGFPTDGATND